MDMEIQITIEKCFRYCSKDCEGEGSTFVCGSDSNLYRNVCEMKKANCGRHIHQVPSFVRTKTWPEPQNILIKAIKPGKVRDRESHHNKLNMSGESWFFS